MSKLPLAVVLALLLSVGTARSADAPAAPPAHSIKTGVLYQIWFAPDYINAHSSMSVSNQYVIQIDAINPGNPNWVLIEFPQAANQSYTSSLAGTRWVNLSYVMELKTYTPPPGQ